METKEPGLRRLDWPQQFDRGSTKRQRKYFGGGASVDRLYFVKVGNLNEAVRRDKELAKLAEPISVKKEAKTTVIKPPTEAKEIFDQQREEEKRIKKRVKETPRSVFSKSLTKKRKKEDNKEAEGGLFSA